MTREILFRGQRTDNKEWVYGSLVKLKILTSICVESEYDNLSADAYFNECLFPVIPETVTQFTGSFDKQNKRKVFEGDKYKFNSHKFTVKFIKDTFIFESISKGRLSLDYLDTYNIKFLGDIFEGEE